jgi:hypothetical protein
MTMTTLNKLHALFADLDADLEIGLACCIAEQCRTTPAVIFAAYEAWQVA